MATEIVSLEQAKAHLKIAGAAYDEELTRVIDASIATAEGYLGGALVEKEVTDRLDGGGNVLYLQNRPVLALGAVTDNATAAVVTTTGWWVEPFTGRLAVGTTATAWIPADVTITYTVGWPDPIPEDIKNGVLELVRHKWETQRGRSSGRPAGNYDEDPGSGFSTGYGLPNRVKEDLAPHRLVIA